MDANQPVFSVQHLDFYYHSKKALSDINLDILPHKVTALIGPSGCGKSTYLRCLNRMNDTIAGTRVDGRILLDGKNIYDRDMDVVTLRQKVGMVFQKPADEKGPPALPATLSSCEQSAGPDQNTNPNEMKKLRGTW